MDSLPNDIHRLSLYFFLMLPDDKLASNAAKESYREVKRKAAEANADPTNAAALVALLHATRLRFKRKFAKVKEPSLTGTGWLLREPWDLGTWLQFRRTAREDEVEAVVLGQIFALTDAQVARGLELSEGMVRARRLRGLVKLSEIVHQHKLKANA